MVKNGKNRQGRQRFLCRGCKRSFLDSYSGYHLSGPQRKLLLHLYPEGLEIRAIGRVLGFSPTTILRRIRRESEKGLCRRLRGRSNWTNFAHLWGRTVCYLKFPEMLCLSIGLLLHRKLYPPTLC
jgi:IS30 family transposase